MPSWRRKEKKKERRTKKRLTVRTSISYIKRSGLDIWLSLEKGVACKTKANMWNCNSSGFCHLTCHVAVQRHTDCNKSAMD